MTMFKSVENDHLKETMIDNGVLHEANRTFFNPLGLQLTIGPTIDYNLEIKLKEDNEVDIVFPHLDKFQMTMFRDFSNIRYMDREERLGFVIQTEDFTEEDKNYSTNKSIKSKRLDIIFKFFRLFAFEMQKKFMKHHEDNDDDNYFHAKGIIINSFNKSIEDKDWVSVANWAMILQYYEELEEEITAMRITEKEES